MEIAYYFRGTGRYARTHACTVQAMTLAYLTVISSALISSSTSSP